jgi:prephenate dehydrogenase
VKKPLFKKICIVGVGLIGGSIGLAARKRGLAREVVGIVRRPAAGREALKRGCVGRVARALEEGVRGADLVVLCLPVGVIPDAISRVSRAAEKNARVIDVGSTKKEIARAGKKHLGNRFVGCHPMAGSEKTGVGHADACLFEGANCFLTSDDARVAALWRALGARPLRVSPELHDAWVAKLSHLPHLLAFALLRLFEKGHPDLIVQSAGHLNPSFKPLVRLAKSDPELWEGILASNRGEVLKALSGFRKNLEELERALKKGDGTRLKLLIDRAGRSARELWPDE